jgi:hypothetical protein
MKSTRVQIILLIAILFIAVAANEAPLAYGPKDSKGYHLYPPRYPRSVGLYDGWVLESGETTNIGGTANNTSTVVNIGDDMFRKQYRAILHFNTMPYSIPPAAVIFKAVIRIKLQGVVGANPPTTFGRVLVDLRRPSFGSVSLLASDFQALPNSYQVAQFYPIGGGWFKATLSATGRAYINKAGSTQFRLYFKLDDDNDKNADYLMFYSGNASASLRPSLELDYYVP